MTSTERYDFSIIGTAGLPARYGGFETLAEALVKHLSKSCDIAIACEGSKVPPTHTQTIDIGAHLYTFPWAANGWQSIPYDLQAIFALAPRSKALLVLGVSGCIGLPVLRLFKKRPLIVVNTDGIEWKRQKWSLFARVFLRFSEWCAVKFSDVVISDNVEIQRFLDETYGVKSVYIPYGVYETSRRPDSRESRSCDEYFLGLCRIEPENNVHLVLRAFAESKTNKLVFVGNWNASSYGVRLKTAYADAANITLLDPVYDPDRLGSLRSGAIAYVHGHSAGGTNPSLVEAMGAGLASLCFDVPYNRSTTENVGFFWKNVAELKALLAQLTTKDYDRCGCKLQEVAERAYKWDLIAESYRVVLQAPDDKSHAFVDSVSA